MRPGTSGAALRAAKSRFPARCENVAARVRPKGPQIDPGSRLTIRLKAIMTLLAHIEGRELSVARKT
ncbi:MAG: hypothetical protein H6955_14155 [Chromatiaceae bacterium]|nr:hypothetical protein [Chromatiaceae bacterium]